MKKILFTLAILVTSFASAQVGIGNTDPKATLDVNKASYSTGEQAGIAVTQLSGSQIVAMTTTDLKSGTLVYATNTSGVIDTIGFWYYNGTSWSRVGAPSNLNVTAPTTDNYTVLETDAIIYRNLTGAGTLTFPSTLPAGKVFYISNTSGTSDWSFSPAPVNTTTTLIAAGLSATVVTLGSGQIMVTTGY
jgi:hypothetical protein